MTATMPPDLWEEDEEPPAWVTPAAPSLDDEEEDPFGHGGDFSWSPPLRRVLREATDAGYADGGAPRGEVGNYRGHRLADLGSEGHGTVRAYGEVGDAAGADPSPREDRCVPPKGEAPAARSQKEIEDPRGHEGGTGWCCPPKAAGSGAPREP